MSKVSLVLRPKNKLFHRIASNSSHGMKSFFAASVDSMSAVKLRMILSTTSIEFSHTFPLPGRGPGTPVESVCSFSNASFSLSIFNPCTKHAEHTVQSICESRLKPSQPLTEALYQINFCSSNNNGWQCFLTFRQELLQHISRICNATGCCVVQVYVHSFILVAGFNKRNLF